jgi:uncharacterized membrane protein
VIRSALLALLALACLSAQARADLKLCNRMSYIVEAAIGIDDRGTTATRGWFRIDPAQCRVVAQGQITAERIFLHARALPIYGASPQPQGGANQLCVGSGDFIVAAARACQRGQTAVPFIEVKPTQAEDGSTAAYLAEDAGYDDEQARFAAIQRLLLVGGYDAAPIDGVDGPKTQAALQKFLRDRGLNAATIQQPNFFETLLVALQSPTGAALSWCNDTPYRVMAAVGIDDGKTTVTRGWYRIDPGKCINPDVLGKPRRLFSFAEAVNSEGKPMQVQGRALNWGGNATLCTRETKFEIGEHGDCAARGFAATPFVLVNGEGQTLRFKN